MPPPVPAPSQPMVAPAVGGGVGGEEQEQEFVIFNDDGFVYKVPRGLYPDAAPSSTQAAAGPDPVTAGLRRRRRALLRLRAKRLRQLSRWEALASELLAPLPAPGPAASQAPPASPHPVPATAASASVLDDLLAQADVQAELLKKASELCDEIDGLCDAREAAIVDDISKLLVWGNPRELMVSLCRPDEQTEPGGLDEGNGGLQSFASAAIERVKVSGDKGMQSPSKCKSCFQFSCTGKTCRETHAEQGVEISPPILTENRKRRVSASPSSSKGVAAEAPNKSKRKKPPGSKSTPSGTPGSITRSRAASRSPGPTTRTRAAGLIMSSHKCLL